MPRKPSIDRDEIRARYEIRAHDERRVYVVARGIEFVPLSQSDAAAGVNATRCRSAAPIAYVLNSAQNPIYAGRFELQGRYMTCGQHAFVYDFVRTLTRIGLDVHVFDTAVESFPLAAPIRDFAPLAPLERMTDAYGLVFIDDVSRPLALPRTRSTPRVLVLHDARATVPQAVLGPGDRVLCMSDVSVARQRGKLGDKVPFLARQGIDLERFRPLARGPERAATPRVLVMSRLDRGKADAILELLPELIDAGIDTTILGSGDAWWDVSDTYGERATIVHHVPCHSVQRFLPRFDVVLSSGRGLMEALACGVPAICAGFGYGGPVTPESIGALRERNMTSLPHGGATSAILADVHAALRRSPTECRDLAERYFSIERMIEDVFEAVLPTAPPRVSSAPGIPA